MITIEVKPSRLRFGRRKQWTFKIRGANNKPIDPRDTYANPGDIRASMIELVDGGQPVELVTHYRKHIRRERLR
ncbi:hypothetical protein BH11ACT6_BH11ACT6_34550 [soil metagenome]